MEPLKDEELDAMLRHMPRATAPESLDATVGKALGSTGRIAFWRWLLHGEVRIPVPLGAACLAATLVFGAVSWNRQGRAPAVQPVRTQMVNLSFEEFRPVEELKVRIVRTNDENQQP